MKGAGRMKGEEGKERKERRGEERGQQGKRVNGDSQRIKSARRTSDDQGRRRDKQRIEYRKVTGTFFLNKNVLVIVM